MQRAARVQRDERTQRREIVMMLTSEDMALRLNQLAREVDRQSAARSEDRRTAFQVAMARERMRSASSTFATPVHDEAVDVSHFIPR